LFAKDDLQKNTIVTYYDGNLLSWIDAQQKSDVAYMRTVAFGHQVIDGLRIPLVGRGAGSFVNHSCDPNAEFHIRSDTVWIKTKKDIHKGMEILVNYGRTYWKRSR
jgi:hypothetical protein